MQKKSMLMAAVVLAAGVTVAEMTPGVSPGAHFATDAYPGFDMVDDVIGAKKKEPRWFQFVTGPKMPTAVEQLAWAEQLALEGSWGKAVKAYDAIVRNWPVSPEAPKAQKAMADILLGRLLDYEEAFKEYRYMLDFYSLDCDYDATAALMYKVANLMREAGKTFIFMRFDNTVDVRRAYESLILRSPGASFVPEAMLTVADLRMDEGAFEKAVTVYENLRNLHPKSSEAKTATYREAETRMIILREHGYNRARARDTIAYLKLAAAAGLGEVENEQLAEWKREAEDILENEAYKGAKFYDSPTRTKRSAVNAYEKFLKEYPDGAHSDLVRARLGEIKGDDKQ